MITETHLKDEETKKLVIPGYQEINHDCRQEVWAVGVLILAKMGLNFTKLDEVPRPEIPVNACSGLLFFRQGKRKSRSGLMEYTSRHPPLLRSQQSGQLP